MLQAAEAVLHYTTGKTRDDYEREDILRHAVERNIEIIGESTAGSATSSAINTRRSAGERSWPRVTSSPMSMTR